jgi:hypothetical protein
MKPSSQENASLRRRAHGLAATILPLALFALLALAPSSAWAQAAVAPAAGDGLTTDTAYQITELGNMAWLHDQAAAAATTGKYYKLMNDIDASDTATWNDDDTTTDTLEGFAPIGSNGNPFLGVFDGMGHKISGLVINRSSTDYVGLFGYVGSGGKASHLGLVNGSVTGSSNVGGLVGYNDYGTITDCHVTGSVTGNNSYIGGLVGDNPGTVTECYATGSVTGNSYVGALVGYNPGTVTECHATGAVTGTLYVGGLVGYNSYGTVLECYATGAVTGSGNYVGGLVGNTYGGTITECHATGAVTGSWHVGGLIGINDYGTVTECHATGAVTGSQYNIGGLVGDNSFGTVTECYATGAVTGTDSVGGLVGFNGYDAYVTVTKCYATGAVTGGSFVGGLVGCLYSGVLRRRRGDGKLKCRWPNRRRH